MNKTKIKELLILTILP